MSENLQMFLWYIIIMGILGYVFTGIDKMRPLNRVMLWLVIIFAWPLLLLYIIGEMVRDFGKELKDDIKLRLEGK